MSGEVHAAPPYICMTASWFSLMAHCAARVLRGDVFVLKSFCLYNIQFPFFVTILLLICFASTFELNVSSTFGLAFRNYF